MLLKHVKITKIEKTQKTFFLQKVQKLKKVKIRLLLPFPYTCLKLGIEYVTNDNSILNCENKIEN